MSELRTPEALSTQAENELICEKLLGWTSDSLVKGRKWPWLDRHGNRRVVTPTFADWASAGLILEALDDDGLAWILANGPDGDYEFRAVPHAMPDRVFYAETGPLAIRRAAIEYIKVMKS